MPRGKARSVHAIFEQFVGSLSALIKVKVAESVNAATSDFFAAKFGGVIGEKAASAAPIRRRRRRRRRTTEPQPVKLSKQGKRLGRPPKKRGPGRPPKVTVVTPTAEETKTE